MKKAETPHLDSNPSVSGPIRSWSHLHLSNYADPITRFRGAWTVCSRSLRGGGRRFGRRGGSGGALRVSTGVRHQLRHRPAPIDVLKLLYLRGEGESQTQGSALGNGPKGGPVPSVSS